MGKLRVFKNKNRGDLFYDEKMVGPVGLEPTTSGL